MAFSEFKTLLDVSAKYNIVVDNTELFSHELDYKVDTLFMEDLRYSLLNKKPNPSEIALSENFISPIIRYVVKNHPHLIYWSREYYLNADEMLQGTPDYLFSYTEKAHRISKVMPLVCVAEAKTDDFSEAWAQTLAELVACQKLYPAITLYGFATNGLFWQFGKLEGDVFTQDINSYGIAVNTSQIAGILNYIFTEAVAQAELYLARQKQF